MNKLQRPFSLLLRSIPRLLLLALLALYLLAAFSTYFDYLEPYLPFRMGMGRREQLNQRVIVGPFPHYDDLLELKQKGVKTVISLMTPTLPPERQLIASEQRAAARIGGITVTNFPLNYLDLHGEKNMRTLAEMTDYIRQHPRDTVYIHCYLGRHRVGLVKEHLARAGLITRQPGGKKR